MGFRSRTFNQFSKLKHVKITHKKKFMEFTNILNIISNNAQLDPHILKYFLSKNLILDNVIKSFSLLLEFESFLYYTIMLAI